MMQAGSKTLWSVVSYADFSIVESCIGNGTFSYTSPALNSIAHFCANMEFVGEIKISDI